MVSPHRRHSSPRGRNGVGLKSLPSKCFQRPNGALALPQCGLSVVLDICMASLACPGPEQKGGSWAGLCQGEATGPSRGLRESCGRWAAVVPWLLCPLAVGWQWAPARAAACTVGSVSVSCSSDPAAGAMSFPARPLCSPLQHAVVSPSCCRIPRAP